MATKQSSGESSSQPSLEPKASLAPGMTPDMLPPRVAGKIEVDADDHWMWTGWLDRGYGVSHAPNPVRPACGMTRAHRAVYALLVGDPGENLHHECGVKACCNPYHMTPLTIADHASEHSTRTHCIHGHDLSDAYIVNRSDKDTPQRFCRPCTLAQAKNRLEAQAARRGLDPDPTVRRTTGRKYLTKAQVREVKRRLSSESNVQIADSFGVSTSTISGIRSGRRHATT